MELSEALDLEAEINGRRRDYTEDFEGLQEVYALDYAALEGAAALILDPEGPWEAALEAKVENRDYDEKFPRDTTGRQVLGAEAEVRRTEVDFSLAYALPAAADVEVGVERFLSDDRYAGWWAVSYTHLTLPTKRIV